MSKKEAKLEIQGAIAVVNRVIDYLLPSLSSTLYHDMREELVKVRKSLLEAERMLADAD